MEQNYYLISDAAKKVEVETHVLRYWEEELNLTIKRNDLGHRFYTKEDVERFIRIKKLKEQGFQLKAIRLILINGNLNRIGQDGKLISHNFKERTEKEKAEEQMEERPETEAASAQDVAREDQQETVPEKMGMIRFQPHVEMSAVPETEGNNNKSYRLQMLLKQMISEAVRENNQELCDDIKSSVLKELDYQFRAQEEKQEEREKERLKREEEHFRKLDEVLRSRAGGRRKKKNPLF